MDDIEKWINDNSYKYDLTETAWESGEGGWSSYKEASAPAIAQMYRDMIAENGCVVIKSDLEDLEDENERLRAENARLRVENGQLEQVAAGLIREARVE